MDEQESRFRAWARARMGSDERLEFLRPTMWGGPLDHAFVANAFPVWGGDMFEALPAPVEYVVVGDPYGWTQARADAYAAPHGLRVWVLEETFWYQGTTPIVFAVVDGKRALHWVYRVAHNMPVRDWLHFFPPDFEPRLPAVSELDEVWTWRVDDEL